MNLFKSGTRPTLGSVIGRGHLIVALVGVAMASVSLTLLGGFWPCGFMLITTCI